MSVIQFCPDSIQAGGFTSGPVRSWYRAKTTFGMRDLIMIK